MIFPYFGNSNDPQNLYVHSQLPYDEGSGDLPNNFNFLGEVLALLGKWKKNFCTNFNFYDLANDEEFLHENWCTCTPLS